MSEKESSLGELQAVYGTSPVYLQRAAIVAVLSCVFFLGMRFVFSLTQKLVFFLLSTAFLVVELFTLFGWLAQRRNELKVYEKGFVYKKQNYLWEDLREISVKRDDQQKISGEIETKDNKKILFTDSIHNVESFFKLVEAKIIKSEKAEK